MRFVAFQNKGLTWLDAHNIIAKPEMLKKLQAVNQPQALVRRQLYIDNNNR